MEIQVHIFKTSVKTKKAVQSLSKQLNILLAECRWNFDLEDCDKILRVESSKNLSDVIIKVLGDNYFECEEIF